MNGKNIITNLVTCFCLLKFIYRRISSKKIEEFVPKDVQLIKNKINRIVPTENKIQLGGGEELTYDILIIATGAKIAPEETEGMKGKEWQRSVFDFYTFEGSLALRNKLRD